MPPMFARLSRGLLARRWIPAALAILLLATSLLLAWQRERTEAANQARESNVQAEILAGSLTGALAFDDLEATNEHLTALRLDRDIRAAAVYDAQGRRVAGFAQRGELPASVRPHAPQVHGLDLTVVAPIRQGNLALGEVYLRTAIEPFSARVSRYLVIGIVIVLAALLIAILGASYSTAAAANEELEKQIAAREKAETALRQAQKMEAMGQLTGGVAHDFNNLLMAASSGLELMGRVKDPERIEKLKAGVREALDRGARLTQQLLAFSRRTPVKTEVVELQSRIDKLANLLDHALQENVEVKFDLAEDLWPIEVDASQFDVAVLNIALNARDAMPKGGHICILGRNRPDALDGEDAVELSLQDEGAGMTAEAIEKAFEPFYTTKDVGRGTGLGLSQVYGFTRASGGRVSIESEPGEGTTVTMLIPRCHKVEELAATRATAATAPALAGVTVLLVEDDPSLNELVGQMLEELGSKVVHAANAREGIAAFVGAGVGAVLSDMVMPGGMDGLELARRLRGERADLPVVLMTGYSAAAGSAASEGFAVLRKPFTMDALAERLTEAIGRPPPAAS
jgi:signal transduction histidine kinase/CheY-like chemotaxis protein